MVDKALKFFIFYRWLTLLVHPATSGAKEISHVRHPVELSVGQCISFECHPVYRAVGKWTWRKDAIGVSTSDRVVIHGNTLRISDVGVGDSAYYSAEVRTTEGKELFKFWLTVKDCDINERKTPYFQGSCRSWCEKKCEKRWNHFQGRCFKYFSDIQSWEDALDSCQSKDATLAVVDDKEKNEFVGALLQSGEGAWIGLNDRYAESIYLWNNDRDEKASYFAWENDEPSNTNSKCNIENCVEMKYPSLKWNDMVCNGYNSHVCQLAKDSENVTSSWSCYGSSCFKYFPSQLIWKDSKEKCEELGGELAKIASSSLLQFVGSIIQRNVWIGLNDIAEPGTYLWQNSEVGKLSDKALFFNWDTGEPNDLLYESLRLGEQCSGEDCVRINRWDNVVSWQDMECSQKLPYVCEKSRNSLLTIGAVIGISVGCTTVTLIVAAFIQFRLRHRKNKVQVKRLVFNTRN